MNISDELVFEALLLGEGNHYGFPSFETYIVTQYYPATLEEPDDYETQEITIPWEELPYGVANDFEKMLMNWVQWTLKYEEPLSGESAYEYAERVMNDEEWEDLVKEWHERNKDFMQERTQECAPRVPVRFRRN